MTKRDEVGTQGVVSECYRGGVLLRLGRRLRETKRAAKKRGLSVKGYRKETGELGRHWSTPFLGGTGIPGSRRSQLELKRSQNEETLVHRVEAERSDFFRREKLRSPQ